MTRTELLHLAESIIKNPVDCYDDFNERGTVYTSSYRKKAISVFQSFRNTVIALAYNQTCYFINPTDSTTAQRLRTFCDDNKVKTRVFLYPRSRCLFADEQGIESDKITMSISRTLDYSDVIPIPF